MPRMIRRTASVLASLVVCGVLATIAPRVSGQAVNGGFPSKQHGEWATYSADVRGSRYMPLDARTGEQKWVYSMDEGRRADVAPRKLSGRGLSYWTDGKGDERIIYVT